MVTGTGFRSGYLDFCIENLIHFGQLIKIKGVNREA